MKKKTSLSYAHMLLGTIAAVVVLCIVVIFLFISLKKTQHRMIVANEASANRVLEIEHMFKTITGEVALQRQSSAEALLGVRDELLDTVTQELDTVNQEIVRVESSSSEQVLTLGAQIIATKAQARLVIDTWAPRVARTKCDTIDEEDPDKIGSFSRGSATLFANGSSHMLITNAHVIDNNAHKPQASEECSVTFDDQDKEDAYIFPFNKLKLQDEDASDIGHMLSTTKLAGRENMDLSAGLCTHIPTVGDEIIVLGYPKIGAKESITITEGVIAGFEDDFYVTSANIASGSSGGAAIDLGYNCYLGIPTFTRIDRTGSLGRILRVDSFSEEEEEMI